MSIIEQPLCACILEIEKKYTRIGAKAWMMDREEGGKKHLDEAYRKHHADYLLEVMCAEHHCSQIEIVENSLKNDRRYWETQIKILPFEEAMKRFNESRMNTGEQADRYLEKIKERTSSLIAICSTDYWIYYNSLQRAKNFAKIEPELTQRNADPASAQPENTRFKAMHYALAYIFDCDANGTARLIGQKNKLEGIGQKRGVKGNTFYKNCTTAASKDLNAESCLIELAGEDWREIILQLSNNPALLEKYLDEKNL